MPYITDETMALVRKALGVGCRYSLPICAEALNKLDGYVVTDGEKPPRAGLQGGGFLAPGFPTRLRTLRIKRHLTVSALAVRSGVNATQISRYENDQAIPVPLTVEKLATALNVNITELTDAALPSRAIGVSSATQRGNDEEM
jgi:hypothetical protein